MKNVKYIYIGSFFVISLGFLMHSQNSEKYKFSDMSKLTPRLQKVFAKTKPVCFGRFVIDVPESVGIAWGAISVPYELEFHQNGVEYLEMEAKNFINELSSEKAIYHNKVPLLLEVRESVQPEGKIVVGYEGFEAINGLKIRAYFQLGKNALIINSRPMADRKEIVINDLINTARRVRQRIDEEIPSESGNCIEDAFLADKKDPSEDDLFEHIRIGFRIEEFPDAHLSIYVAPAGDDPEDDSLESQMKATKSNMNTVSERLLLSRTRFFREGNRQIRDWKTGYEVLMRSPDEDESLSHHDFHLRFNGVLNDPYKPYVDIKFETGVANNAAGATKTSLTDEEAIAIWDKITSSIRVRPTTSTAVKTSAAGDAPHRPLGELAATGRTCPQTGWWEASEEDNVTGQRRRHFKVGELMPHAVSQGKPTMWQKFKGEHSSYRTATVWKLVSYDDGPAQAEGTAPRPTIALTGNDSVAATEAKEERPDDTGDGSHSPKQG